MERLTEVPEAVQLKEAYIPIAQRSPQLLQRARATASPFPDPGASPACSNPGPSLPHPRAEHILQFAILG